MSSQYQQEQLRPHSYQASLTAVLRCLKLSTASFQATCTWCRLTYWQNVLMTAFANEWSAPTPLFRRRLAGLRKSQDLVYCTRCLSWPTAPHKPLIGQHDTETTAGRTQQPLIVLSAIDVMWFVWHIVSVDEMNGCVADSTDCHSHEQKLYC